MTNAPACERHYAVENGMTSDPIQATDPSADEAVRALRRKARGRKWYCSGGGFALLGRPVLAIVAYLLSFLVFVVMAWAAMHPSAEALLSILVAIVIASAFIILEHVMISRATPHAPRPAFLVAGFPIAVGIQVVAGLGVLIIILSNIGSVRLAGGGMSPTLEKGELVLYHKHAEEGHLQRGHIILFKLSNQSAWGQPGSLVISRIEAMPGDRLSIHGSQYFINGQPGSAIAPTGQFAPVIAIPQDPGTVQVPESCYFIVQDAPEASFDSRILGWVQQKDVVSTSIYYLGAHGILKSVK